MLWICRRSGSEAAASPVQAELNPLGQLSLLSKAGSPTSQQDSPPRSRSWGHLMETAFPRSWEEIRASCPKGAEQGGGRVTELSFGAGQDPPTSPKDDSGLCQAAGKGQAGTREEMVAPNTLMWGCPRLVQSPLPHKGNFLQQAEGSSDTLVPSRCLLQRQPAKNTQQNKTQKSVFGNPSLTSFCPGSSQHVKWQLAITLHGISEALVMW